MCLCTTCTRYQCQALLAWTPAPNQSIKSPTESQALVSKVLSFAQFVHDWRGAIGVLQS